MCDALYVTFESRKISVLIKLIHTAKSSQFSLKPENAPYLTKTRKNKRYSSLNFHKNSHFHTTLALNLINNLYTKKISVSFIESSKMLQKYFLLYWMRYKNKHFIFSGCILKYIKSVMRLTVTGFSIAKYEIFFYIVFKNELKH